MIIDYFLKKIQETHVNGCLWEGKAGFPEIPGDGPLSSKPEVLLGHSWEGERTFHCMPFYNFQNFK